VRVSDFHFDLPEDLIAQHPPAQRGSSRMLVMQRGAGAAGASTLRDAMFADLPQLLQPGDLLVLNDSRVLPARLFGRRVSARTQAGPGGMVEALLVEEVEPAVWRTLVKPGRKVRLGDQLEFSDASGTDVPALTAEVIATGEFGERTLRFSPTPDFHTTLKRIGHMPLPPYIRRDQSTGPDAPEDLTRYQTVYANQPGSAAAPTAGLHFTPQILDALKARGVEIATLTLHVGLGTFQPVRVAELADIRLHSERYTLPPSTADALNRARTERRRIVAVGTTTTRVLEHVAAQLGAPHLDSVMWDSTTGHRQPAVLPHSGSTAIFLAPGHPFRIVSGLLTNFHLPESTLLMLVAAFAAQNPDAGRRAILRAYAHAIQQHYRFYSYGDCMLLL
jgi:S-adenosylmethionine:tRNA ribosyltransferase-isomerase